ncbi:hypothetical protein [Lacticaseibacillus kribbianus]|uniref:hypothetical protein n=1 Tax=Lacticaseibacillus kribbianus TaxID=2926292 RepID=UPI001CD19557|nr:hypothetical protein [Lacticaseibacillus kribbianus]
MEINVTAFQEAIENGNYQTTQFTATPEQVAQDGVEKDLQPAFAALDAALDQGILAQVDLVIESAEPTTVRLETGVINLPFADSRKVNNFLDEDATVPLRVNLIVISPYVNQSGLRIDIVAEADAYVQNRAANQAAVIAEVQEKLALIEAERTAPKPEALEVPAARAKATTTRKTAAKKTTTRKATAKKTTAKKTTTRKSAAKTTAAKKAATKTVSAKTAPKPKQ